MKKRTGISIAIAVALLLAGCSKTPQQIAEDRAEVQQKAEQLRNKESVEQPAAEVNAEPKHSGSHCINGPDGTNRQVVKYIKLHYLTVPESFEHTGTVVTPEENGMIALVMSFTAQNQYGGTSSDTIMASLDPKTCEPTYVFQYK